MTDQNADAIAAALVNNPVYNDGSDNSTDGLASYGQNNIAIVMLDSPPSQSATSLANDIKAKGSFNTVIVSVDGAAGDSWGVATSGNADSISQFLYSKRNESDGGSILKLQGDNIITAATKTKTVTSTEHRPTPKSSDGIGVFGTTSILLAVVVVGTVGGKFLKKKLADRNAAGAPIKIYDKIPDDLKEELERLRDIEKKHQIAPSGLSKEITPILINSNELFRRLQKNADSLQARIAAVEYHDTLQKLNKALDSDYYLDICKNPSLWTDPEQRVREVQDAVRATAAQLIVNIQQVNASKDLEFKVALEQLSKNIDNPTVENIYGKTAK